MDANVAVTGVSFDTGTSGVQVGAIATFQARILPANASNPAVTYTSSDSGVATVDPTTGVVTGVSPGTAIITATTQDGKITGTITVNVSPVPVAVTGISVNLNSLQLVAGTSGLLTITVAPAGATNSAVTWSSSNPSVATVDPATGTVSGLTAGTTTLTVTTDDGGFSATVLVTVTPAVATPYTIGGTVAGLNSGSLVLQNNDADPLTLSASGAFQFANKVSDYTVTVRTQPSPLQCAVTNGSGTATADVTLVAVNCTAYIYTWAGTGQVGAGDGASAATAQFNAPYGVAVDQVSGDVYIADTGNNSIRKITPGGVLTTLAGGTYGLQDAMGTSAQFRTPRGVAVDDTSGVVYVADTLNHRIRMIDFQGNVTTLAGGGSLTGFNNGSYQDGALLSARFNNPSGVAVFGGYVYVADTNNHRIRKIDTASNGVVTTIAGSGTAGFQDGSALSAQFNSPTGVALDGSGNVYVADNGNHSIRKIDTNGNVSTLAGSGASGSQNGLGVAAGFKNPSSVAVDASGNVYVADSQNSLIRKIDSSGNVTTLAGDGVNGFRNNPVLTAEFNIPTGIALDKNRNVFIADQMNHRIRATVPQLNID